MATEPSDSMKSRLVIQALGQQPLVRAAIAIVFFAVMFFAFQYPWPILLILAGVIYWLVGWLSAEKVVPKIDHDAEARSAYQKVVDRCFALAGRIQASSATRNNVREIARSSAAILEAADSTDKLRLCSQYFQSLEDLYLPNVELLTSTTRVLDTRSLNTFENDILPKLVSRAAELQDDMVRDERFAFESRSEMLALDLGMLPELDFAPASTKSRATREASNG